MTFSQVAEAEHFAAEQRMTNFKLLQADASKGGTPEESALWETAQDDPLKFDGMLGKTEVGKLFACGALHFGRAA